CCISYVCFFFFSSRRRHTRSDRDWSSDVCSSDLGFYVFGEPATGGFTPNGGGFAEYVKAMPWVAERGIVALPDNVSFEEATFIEIGRASCRERVYICGVGVAVKRNKVND